MTWSFEAVLLRDSFSVAGFVVNVLVKLVGGFLWVVRTKAFVVMFGGLLPLFVGGLLVIQVRRFFVGIG